MYYKPETNTILYKSTILKIFRKILKSRLDITKCLWFLTIRVCVQGQRWQSQSPGAVMGPCQASSGAWLWPPFLQLLCKLCRCNEATQPQSEMCHNNREPPQFICQWIKGPLSCPNLTSREAGTAIFLGFQKERNKIWWKDNIISTTPNTIPSLFPLMKGSSWRWGHILAGRISSEYMKSLRMALQ